MTSSKSCEENGVLRQSVKRNRDEAPRRVLDASAVLAFVHRERGYELVRPVIRDAAISAVNLAEVLVKLQRAGVDPNQVSTELERRGLRTIPFGDSDAKGSAAIDARVARKGALSLGDRACLALGERLGAAIFTAEREWGRLGLGLDLRLIR